MRKIASLLIAAVIALTCADISYAAVAGEQLINVQNSSSTFVLSPRRVKDAGDAADNLTSGLMATGGFVYDGTNWDKMRGDTTYGLDVDVTRISGSITMIGASTIADNYANPTTAINAWSLLGAYDGSTWDRLRTGVNAGTLLVDNTSTTSSNITTNATTAVKATTGTLNRVYVNVAGTATTAKLYNIASAGCTNTPASGYVATITTTAANNGIEFNHTFTNGICVLTAGDVAADITVLYR